MNQPFISYDQEYLKTLTFSTLYQKQFQKSTYLFPITSHQQKSHNMIKQMPNIKKMIGYDRLLDSLSNFESSHRRQKNNNFDQVIEDRFIPFRKQLQRNYKLKQNKQNYQNSSHKDPQSLQIAQIFSQQVLGSKQPNQFSQSIQTYHNNNMLKYKIISNNKKLFGVDLSSGENNKKTNSILCEAYTKMRKVNKLPCKVLDAPALQDDFYLNLIDWSHQNILAVGLSNSIYLWNATNSKVTKLCELTSPTDIATSVSWALRGNQIAIGCTLGDIQIWDVDKCKLMRKLKGHEMRVGSMAWNSNSLASGSRDKTILQRDMRCNRDYVIKMEQHTQEICGMKWSLDQQYLASGGNDNKVIVWSAGGQMINKFTDHKAAVKALAWSPHQHGLLATGGGTADRIIRMRNVLTGTILCEKDAGSQVCNIAFSKSLHEIVSTHGYGQNEINIWSYPNMKKVASLIGHSCRVLYLATSPDGSTIVTGAGDQTLRFWNVFPPVTKQQKQKQELFFNSIELR